MERVVRWRTCQDRCGGEEVRAEDKRRIPNGVSEEEKKRGSPVSSAGMGFIKVLSSPQALTAKVMTGEFRWC